MSQPRDFSRRDFSRRDFLRQLGLGGAAVVAGGYGLSVWGPSGASAQAAVVRAGELATGAHGRTLVVVEMAGGNDGLNTVVPLNSGTYHDLRPTLGVTNPIPLDGEVGLHPNLAKLAQRFGQGHVAVVEGLGYPEPDLSHFGSIAVWWSGGRPSAPGWLGTYLDGTVGFDDPLAAIGIGPGPSPALSGAQSFATTIADTSGLQPRLPTWLDGSAGGADTLLRAWGHETPHKVDASTLTGAVQRAVGLTVQARTDLGKALDDAGDVPAAGAASPQSSAAAAGSYQDRTVVESLALAAELITSPAKPKVIYVSGIGDFDTHDGETQRHPALMTQLDDGIDGFFTALGDAADGVVLMTVSEFGRRPQENGGGTDHGTANAHFVIGPKVTGGRYGAAPSLTDLDRTGNMTMTTDFRSLYSTVLDRWLDVDAAHVLGAHYPSLGFLT
jgi:uncharacterized protein (DUF1501 family)